MFLRVPQLFYTFPAAQTSKWFSQKIVYKTSYPSSGPSYIIRLWGRSSKSPAAAAADDTLAWCGGGESQCSVV